MIELKPSEINGYACPSDPGEPGQGTPRLSINDVEGSIISEFARGRKVLEIGTGLGVSTRWLAKTAAHVWTVDVDPWVQATVFPTLPENVTTLDDLPGASLCAEMAFVDGWHVYDAVVKDIRRALDNTQAGAPIIFHDLYISGVYQALMNSGISLVHIETIAGLALIWNDGRKE